MQSQGNANHFVSIGINFGVLIISLFPTWILLSELDRSHEVVVTEGEVAEKVFGGVTDVRHEPKPLELERVW